MGDSALFGAALLEEAELTSNTSSTRATHLTVCAACLGHHVFLQADG